MYLGDHLFALTDEVKDIMTKQVITVTEKTPLEEAAKIMLDHKIGGLPVMRGQAGRDHHGVRYLPHLHRNARRASRASA